MITAAILKYHLYFCIYFGAFISTLILLGIFVNTWYWVNKQIKK